MGWGRTGSSISWRLEHEWQAEWGLQADGGGTADGGCGRMRKCRDECLKSHKEESALFPEEQRGPESL